MAIRAANEDQAHAREWFTAAELAELGLPGLAGDKRAINRRAQEERWSMRSAAGEPLCRPRTGRGGGVEFHVSLLPATARLELARRGETAVRPSPVAADTDTGGWRWLEAQSSKVRAEGERRLQIILELELLEGSGMTRTAAINEVASRLQIGKATLWTWLRLIEGVARENRLPALAPRRKGGGAEAEMDPGLWNLFLSDYLRLSAPTLSACYDRTAAVAAEKGLSMPSEKTLRRRIEREIPKPVLLYRRGGEEALRRSIPSQRRTVADLHALECVNIDGHKFDVFVKTPDGRVIRPIMVAIQDVYSRKFLSWRVGGEESAVQARLAFADVFETFGIPKECVLDNGRAWASKWITGGAKSRFRFKIKEEEPTGLLTGLGIGIHWALPYRGQSKPIERGFRDLCETIAKHPAMEGAYTGNNPMAKPENYGSRAIEWNAFLAHVDRGMAAHNAKQKRRTEMARGRSFDDVFNESYASASARIGKASPDHMRQALLAAEQKRVDRRTGEIELYGNRYWSASCGEYHGEKVTVRFDPDNLLRDVHLYAQDGRYLTSATVIQDTGFLNAAEAKDAAKRWANYRKQIRGAADAHMLLEAEQVAAMQADVPLVEVPEPVVIRPVRHRGQTAAALKVAPQAGEAIDRDARMFAALGKLRVVD